MFIRFVKTIAFESRDDLSRVAGLLPRGQWIEVAGIRGRLIGVHQGNAWVAEGPMLHGENFARACRSFAAQLRLDAAKVAQNGPVAAKSGSPATSTPSILGIAVLALFLAILGAAFASPDWRVLVGSIIFAGSSAILSRPSAVPFDDASRGYSMRVPA